MALSATIGSKGARDVRLWREYHPGAAVVEMGGSRVDDTQRLVINPRAPPAMAWGPAVAVVPILELIKLHVCIGMCRYEYAHGLHRCKCPA